MATLPHHPNCRCTFTPSFEMQPGIVQLSRFEKIFGTESLRWSGEAEDADFTEENGANPEFHKGVMNPVQYTREVEEDGI